MSSRRATSSGGAFAFRILVALIVAGPVFAGCGERGFAYQTPLWKAGYGWQYEQEVLDKETLTGTAPGALDQLEDTSTTSNGTHRLEVFNSTASSVEGIPIYAMAVETKVTADENQSIEARDDWDAWVFSADLNYVEPTYLDWRNQEIQLSSADSNATDGSTTGEPSASDGASGDRPENEIRRLDWPLAKGHEWRHEEHIPQLDTSGVFEGKVVREYTTHVPAGDFQAVRIQGTLTADDLSEVEDSVRSSLDGQGGQVDSLSVSFVSRFNYAYSEQVLNLVYYQEITSVVIKAKGTDGEHNKYDFAYTKETTTTRRLAKFQLTEGIEKPLTFALDVKRGAYAPKPLTPASFLAVEILVTAPALNVAGEDHVGFGVRIYNSSAGEKKLRGPEASYPAVVGADQFQPKYDHSYLEVQWAMQDLDEKGHTFEFLNRTEDTLRLGGTDIPRAGLKQVQATLKIKGGLNGTNDYIYTDSVLFEAYTHTNITATRNATDNIIRAKFEVFPTATRLTVSGSGTDVPPEAACAPAPFPDCITVADSANRQLPGDERSEHMKYETTRLGQTIKGDFTARYGSPATATKITFEIVVRYRPGV